MMWRVWRFQSSVNYVLTEDNLKRKGCACSASSVGGNTRFAPQRGKKRPLKKIGALFMA